MRMKIYKAFSYAFSFITFYVIKGFNFIFDAGFWLKTYVLNVYGLWKLILKGFEWSNFFKCISLLFGAFLISFKMTNQICKDKSNAFNESVRQNVLLGTTNSFYEMSLFRLHGAV